MNDASPSSSQVRTSTESSDGGAEDIVERAQRLLDVDAESESLQEPRAAFEHIKTIAMLAPAMLAELKRLRAAVASGVNANVNKVLGNLSHEAVGLHMAGDPRKWEVAKGIEHAVRSVRAALSDAAAMPVVGTLPDDAREALQLGLHHARGAQAVDDSATIARILANYPQSPTDVKEQGK